ncbi:MAG: hypothetical protein V1720_07920 [bacterium]
MKKSFLLVIILCLPLLINAQNINGNFSSSIYGFERFDTVDVSDMNIRSFQMLNLNINKDNISLRSRLNFETNISNSLDNDPRLRIYNLYLEARNLFDIATIKLGRQSLFNSVAGGVYDGANLKLAVDGISLSGFYGGNVPPYQKLEITDDFAKDYVLGGKLTVTELENFRFAASYIDKNFKSYDYTATRLDANYNPIEVLIQSKSNQYKYLSGEISYGLPDMFEVNTRYDYDLNFNTTSKFEIDGRYTQIEKLGISLYYNYREPRVRYNSIFSVFNYGNTQEIEGGFDYKVNEMFTVIGKFGNVTYEDENSQRLTLGVNTCCGSLNYRKTFGYAGELDAVSFYCARSFLDGFLTPSVGLGFTSYKLSKDSEKNSLVSVLAGVNVRPWQLVSFDLQGQYMSNKIYKNDVRILFKFNYWFNTNLGIF